MHIARVGDSGKNGEQRICVDIDTAVYGDVPVDSASSAATSWEKP